MQSNYLESTFAAAMAQKCPRCRKGDMFVSSNYNLAHFSEMHDNCPCCNLYFQVEPGFFTGAMYFSYAASVFIIISMTVILSVSFHNPPIWVYIISIVTVSLAFTPLNFRYSRVLMLYLFGGVKKLNK
jgi:uncharacterized protein (DUF983 family)